MGREFKVDPDLDPFMKELVTRAWGTGRKGTAHFQYEQAASEMLSEAMILPRHERSSISRTSVA
jgi:hypothetical protein